MAQENGASNQGAAGSVLLNVETDEIRRIGAVLRGESDPAAGGDDKGGKGAGAAAGDDQGAAGDPDPDPNAAGDPDPDAGGADDQGGEGAADEPITLAELAKSLGTKEGELFDSVQVEVETVNEDGTKGRESVTLGELRRGYVGAVKLERDRETFETTADAKSLEFMQTRAQLEHLGALIAPHAPPEVVQRMQAMLASHGERERALLLEAVPEWKDTAKFTADRQRMIEFLKPWGFSPADVYGIGDHRIARFVRDMARKEARAAEAERKARQRGNGEVKKGQAPDARRGATPLRQRLANIVQAGKEAKTAEGKTAAIGALLRDTYKR